MQFSEVIGQQELIDRLVRLVEEHRVPHALLFSGPIGCGKLAVALAFASYLLGERYKNSSVLETEAKIKNAEAMLHNWQHPDLHFSYPVVKPKSASSDHKTTSDDYAKQWREMLAGGPYFSMQHWMEKIGEESRQAVIYEAESDALSHKLNIKSSMGGYKVSLIWLPERMNAASANKLLKLLEEPPLQTVFLLVSEEPERLLETIKSRVQLFRVKRIDEADIATALIERRGIDEDSAKFISRTASGSWLAALEKLDASSENRQFFDLFVLLMRQAFLKDIKALKKWSEAVAAFGREKQRRMLTYFLRMTRESFMYNFRQPQLIYMTSKEESFCTNFARFINERNVVEMADKLQLTIRDIGQNANAKIQFFNLALSMIIYLRR